MTTLMLRNTVLETISHNGQIWFTSAELAKALQYANAKSISNLYNRNIDEFRLDMTTVIKSMTVRKTGNIDMDVRIFSLRGAHLIAMFANMPIAKEFRKWVLDVLDSKVGQPVHQPEARELFTDDDTSHLARLIWGMAKTASDSSARGAMPYGMHCVMLLECHSAQHFGVSHIPIIAEECQRIYSFTIALKEIMYDAEKQAFRRVLKNREDADAVVSEMKQLLNETNQSHNLLLTNTLARWQQADIQHFLQQH